MGKRVVKPDDVSRIVEPIVSAIGQLGAKLDTINSRLEHVEVSTADTADAVRRVERAVVGIGRGVALEARVRRIEEHLGFPPPEGSPSTTESR